MTQRILKRSWHGRRGREAGQTMTIILLAVGLALLAVAGLTADLGNMYLHRQTAQNAANSACVSAATDMLANVGGNSLGGFSTGTAFSCASNTTASPCKYAALNGYSGAGLTADTASNDVSVSFPSGTGCPNGSPCPAPGVTPPPNSIAPYPFVRVDVVDRVRTSLSGLLTGNKTQDVRAFAVCGMAWVLSPVPIISLAPSGDYTLSQSGSPSITVVGGPVRSVQVNSTSVNAAYVSSIDLTHGGPNYSGSDMGVFGGPSSAPSGFHTSGSGGWRFPSSPFPDPYALLAAPTQPAAAAVPTDLRGTCAKIPCAIAYHNAVHSCPTASGCLLYTAGYYASGINVKNATAIFDPGVYYVNGGMGFDSNSIVRPGTGTGDGSGGTMFYLTGGVQKCSGQTGSVCVGSNSGGTTTDAFDTTRFTCPGAPAPDSRIGLPATLTGNVLLAPCTGTYGDSSGQGRGILFFQDRASSNGGGWGGGGSFLLAGTMYFHHCNSSGTGTGCGSLPNYYNASFTLQGNSGSGSYILGNIIADDIAMGGSPTVTMALNPTASQNVLKAGIFF